MIIGIPKEIKNQEYRVAIIPAGVLALTKSGHQVLVEKNAGIGSGISDEEYIKAGASIVSDKQELFDKSDLIVKVKEPLKEEYDYFHEGQMLFTYLHLASDDKLTKALMAKNIIAIAYETVCEEGRLPLLEPMSEVAGRAAVIMGSYYLSKISDGQGILISGAPGVSSAKVVILGGGTVGFNSAKLAAGLKADVIVFEINSKRIRYLEDVLPSNAKIRMSSEYDISNEITNADLVIGAVLIPGAKAPKLVTVDMVRRMKKGSVMVDVAIDQGGCFETSHPTTHDDPIYEVNGVIHYCVTNIPGIYPQTSTFALCQATHPYLLKIANKGLEMFKSYQPLRDGLNIYKGYLTNKRVAEALGLPYTNLEDVLI